MHNCSQYANAVITVKVAILYSTRISVYNQNDMDSECAQLHIMSV